MEPKPNRPIPVMVAMIFLSIISLVLLVLSSYRITQLLLCAGETGSSMDILARTAVSLAICVACITAVVAIAKRRNWGRFLAISSLVVITGWIYLYDIFLAKESVWGRLTDASLVVGYLYGLFFYYLAPTFMIGCCLYLGQSVAAYFQSVNPGTSATGYEPPPPPIFES